MIRNVVFDIGNVLMDFRWMEYMHSLFGNDNQTIEAVNQTIWQQGTWASMDSGTDAAIAIAKAVSYTPKYEAEIRRAFAHAGQSMHKHDYAIPWIQECKRRGKHVFYLSNYSAFNISANSDVLDFLPYMDGGVFSYQEHMSKPNPEIYRLLCKKYNLKAEECLFTDDMPENIAAAQECGFHAVLFESYEKSYPAIMEAIEDERYIEGDLFRLFECGE